MLEDVRRKAGDNAVILTESNAEPFMDGINMFLTLVAFTGEKKKNKRKNQKTRKEKMKEIEKEIMEGKGREKVKERKVNFTEAEKKRKRNDACVFRKQRNVKNKEMLKKKNFFFTLI